MERHAQTLVDERLYGGRGHADVAPFWFDSLLIRERSSLGSGDRRASLNRVGTLHKERWFVSTI